MPEVCLFLGEYFHEYTKLQNTKTITLVQIYKVDNKKDKCHERNQYKTTSASQDDITTTGLTRASGIIFALVNIHGTICVKQDLKQR